MKCALYRQYDGESRLLYVGISTNIVGRQAQHMRGSLWSDQIACITVAWFDDVGEAAEAEKEAIVSESPLYNIRKPSAKGAKATDDAWRQRLSDALDESGKSKRAVSLAIGASPGYLHGILTEGKDPTIGMLAAICEQLGVSLDALIGAGAA